MKIVFMLLLIVTPMYSQEVVLTNLKAYHYNTMFKTTAEIKLQINGVVEKLNK